MAGRKKLPTNLKIIKGTFRKGRENSDEPHIDPNIPSPPEHLSRDALMEWGRIAPQLYQLGLLSDIYRAALAGYCQAYGRWARAERELNELDRLVDTTPNGMQQQHALVGIANKALDVMHKYMTEFGLTPSSISKVSPKKEEKKQDRWAEFK